MKRKELLSSFTEKLRRLGIDPVNSLADILTGEILLDEETANHPYVQNLIAADYELVPSGNPQKPWALRARLRIRADILKELTGFCFPKLRTLQTEVEQSKLVVQIRNFDIDPVTNQVIEVPPPQLTDASGQSKRETPG